MQIFTESELTPILELIVSLSEDPKIFEESRTAVARLRHSLDRYERLLGELRAERERELAA